MRNAQLTKLTTVLLASIAFAGCLGDDVDADSIDLGAALDTDVDILVSANLTSLVDVEFVESVVDAATNVQSDLYEPTIDVCDDGSIYITGHTAVVDTTGAPVYGSHDGGETWEQLPFTADLYSPDGVPGATPPITDEIYLICGDDGWLYGVDITLGTFPVNAWSDYGKNHAYYNPDAYDKQQVALQADECIAAPINDRPWGAFADGRLLMVNNDGAGPTQVGVMELITVTNSTIDDATPDQVQGQEVPDRNIPYEFEQGVGVGATSGLGRWNVCAGVGYAAATQSIPGVPDMRSGDGLFALPQIGEGTLWLTMGYGIDVFELRHVPVFDFTTGGKITSTYGNAVFDGEGTLFAGISNNTALDEPGGNRSGALKLAVSVDDGHTFDVQTFETGYAQEVRHFWMDGHKEGRGALVVWAVDGDDPAEGEPQRYDWYTAHLQADADGKLVMENVALAIDEGPRPSPHVTGAAVGPNGETYIAMYQAPGELCVPRACVDEPGHTPLSVYIQSSGPRLPGLSLDATVSGSVDLADVVDKAADEVGEGDP